MDWKALASSLIQLLLNSMELVYEKHQTTGMRFFWGLSKIRNQDYYVKFPNFKILSVNVFFFFKCCAK